MQQRSEETRRRILQAAVQLFSKNGYDASGVAEICRAAGVSKGAFYHHFPTKQAVFQALLENWLAGLNTRMEQIIHQSANVPEGLIGIADAAGSIFQDARGQFPMFLEFWTQSSRDPVLWETAIAPYRHFQALFAGALRQGIAEGSLRPVDADAAARALLALGIGVVLQGIIDPDGAAWNKVAQEGIQMLLEGLNPSHTAHI